MIGGTVQSARSGARACEVPFPTIRFRQPCSCRSSERDAGPSILFTRRAASLKNHAGQISFPGGRVEPADTGPVDAALRETEEEIGLARSHVEVVGFLPDHLVISGYRVTPVVALVAPGFEIAVDATEVEEVFEVPMSFVLDSRNHVRRVREFDGEQIEFTDFPYGRHNIWGATAGMLLTLYRTLRGTAAGRLAMSEPLQRLLQIMGQLRDPQDGCAWDREQTFESIVPHTLEEAHEVADAIQGGDAARIRDELGDLLFQVVFLARIAEERGLFDFDAVARGIGDKLVRRHPHVFGAPAGLTADEQSRAWESFKAQERAAGGEQGVLAGVARSLPALDPGRQARQARGTGELRLAGCLGPAPQTR
jgi:NTP pyrophosphatase (non-canonical NTP hydrolase)/8-oxo-dGTP pyrophosphatase MutT (NUDIX family)